MRRVALRVGAVVVLSGALAEAPATAEDPDEVMVACISRVNNAYTGAARNQDYLAFVPVAKVKPLVPPKVSIKSFAEQRFGSWAVATNQYGRWNSVWNSSIDCYLEDAGIEARMMSATNSDKHYARLPADWYKRDAASAKPGEIARYSLGTSAPGSELKNEAALTVKAAEIGADTAISDSVIKKMKIEAARKVRALKKADEAKQNAAMAKFWEDMKKRGSAQ